MNPRTDLLPCPKGHCANLHVSDHPTAGREYGFACECDDGVGLYATEAEASAAWNAQVAPAPEVTQVDIGRTEGNIFTLLERAAPYIPIQTKVRSDIDDLLLAEYARRRSEPGKPPETQIGRDGLVERLDWKDAKEIAAAVVQCACETDPADAEHPDTIMISTDDLEALVRAIAENYFEAIPADPLRARLVEALKVADAAIHEMFRYYDGGETRGSYDGKPERAQLRKAGYVTKAALAELTPESE